MTSEAVAWRHPNPLLRSFVVLPDGYQMAEREAKRNGFTVKDWPQDQKTAVRCPYNKREVLLSRGVVVNRDTAEDAGFQIADHPLQPPPKRSWRTEILNLSEANIRPTAAAELAASETPIAIDQARAFLRGLPTEKTQPKAKAKATSSQDPRAARMTEIAEGSRLYNNARGYSNKPRPAVSLSGVEPARLKRLAEIRLAALLHRGEQVESKKLRYALEVHGKTGSPLAGIFHQLGVDTSKFDSANT